MTKNESTHSIASAKVFAELSAKEKRQLSQLSSTVKVDSGRVLTTQGATGREFGVLIDGTATVTVDGKVVGQLTAGDHYGEIALLQGVGENRTGRTATVTADCELWVSVMTTLEFATFSQDFPAVIDVVREGASERLLANEVIA